MVKEAESPPPNSPRSGRVVTFYSYKGGVGRSMALANTAWILAANGYRVLVIDWDVEAPGLHRYFAPFIEDHELASREGLLEFILRFADAVTMTELGPLGEEDFESLLDPKPFILGLNYPFSGGGKIDLLPAGRQDNDYGQRLTTFSWESFYENLGGGRFIESFAGRMRDKYDYVLIDSRTGVSDTAGICTLQLPDCVVVCFTPNNQSIIGAAEVVSKIRQCRPQVDIVPVLTRVDQALAPLLQQRIVLAKEKLGRALQTLPRIDAPPTANLNSADLPVSDEEQEAIHEAPDVLLFEGELLVGSPGTELEFAL